MSHRLLAFIAATAALPLSPRVAAAADVIATVRADGSGDYTSIEDALAAVAPSDDLYLSVEPGSYPALVVNRGGSLTIEPTEGAEQPVVFDGFAVDAVAARVRVHNATIKGGGVDVGAGRLSLERVFIQSTEDSATSAVRVNKNATLEAASLVVETWTTGEAPIVIEPDATASFASTALFDSDGAQAGAIWNRGGTLTVTDSQILRTHSGSGAGGVRTDAGSTTLADVTIEGASGRAAGAILVSGTGSVSATDLTLADNEAERGAHFRVAGGDLTVLRAEVRGGEAGKGTGLFMTDGAADLRNLDWSNLQATAGGAAVHQTGGTLIVGYATWTRTGSRYGAIAAEGGTADYDGVIIADTEGPALDVGAPATVAFRDGLLWKVGSDNPVRGEPVLESGQLFMAPKFVNPTRDDYALTATSAGLDLGVRGQTDLDGTPADAGMYGGPDAWALADVDGDGFVYGRDCADTSADIHEGAVEEFYDGIDANCDGASDFDQDGDGHDAASFGGDDCDDTDPSVLPGGVETDGDGADHNCDGFDFSDDDGDGWPADVDCADDDDSIRPDAEEEWYDGIDANCDGANDFDQDGDGYDAAAHGGRDCNDEDPHIRPMFPDTPDDGIDQDCDGKDATTPAAPDEAEVMAVEPAQEDRGMEAPLAGVDDDAPDIVTQTGCSAVPQTLPAMLLAFLGGLSLMGRREDTVTTD